MSLNSCRHDFPILQKGGLPLDSPEVLKCSASKLLFMWISFIQLVG